MDKNNIATLIIRAQEGSEEAFNELYNSTGNLLYNSIYPILNDPDLTSDIVQETFLKVLQVKMKNADNGLAYLLTIAKNMAINTFNRRKREVSINFEEEEPIYRDIDILDNSNESHIEDLMQKYLKPNQIELIHLHVIDGLTHREIAEKLGKPLGTIMWQYNEAIKELRKQIKKQEDQ